MPDTQHIAVKPLSCVTPEQARDARAQAWRFVLDAYSRKNPAADLSVRGDNDGTTKEASADEPIIRH
jgi:hypothetical protein